MGQVPRYLLIGDGKVARHFKYYFSLSNISFQSWHRGQLIESLKEKLQTATHVLLLIKDTAIENFINEHLANIKHCLLIHFSGSFCTPLAFGAHPLMTFPNHLYDLNRYQLIPFIIDHHAPAFEELLPGLSNPHVRIHTSLKPKYHALCVLSGNFSTMLWQKFFKTLEAEFNIPHVIGLPYLQQQMQNLFADHTSALSGPLVRGDLPTIEKNIAALEQDPFQEVYKSFIACHQKLNEASQS